MILPTDLVLKTEWTLLGPLGPRPPSSLLTHSILGVDGGAAFADHLDIWVGDGDSSKATPKADHVFPFAPEKAASDLALAFSLFQDMLHYRFHLWGFHGSRLDHEFFNVGESLSFLSQHQESQVIIYAPDGKVRFHIVGAGHWKFKHQGVFSIGASEETMIRVKGACKYPLYDSTKLRPLSSLGLSNEATGEVILENEGPVFIYFPEGQ